MSRFVSMVDPEANPKLAPSWLFILALLCAAGVAYDLAWAHPGIAFPDEWADVALIQGWREGHGLPWYLGGSCLCRLAQACCVALAPNAWLLHVPTWLGMGLECWLLYWLAKRWLDPTSGWLGVAFNLCCPFFWMRARSLMGYSLLPVELLDLLFLAPSVLGEKDRQEAWAASLPSFLWAFCAGILLLDYEAWMLGLPLLLFYIYQSPGLRKNGLSLALGFGFSSLLVLWLSRDTLSSYFHYRTQAHFSAVPGAMLGSGWSNFTSFFWGGRNAFSLGLRQLPVLPPWGLPFLILGCLVAPAKSRVFLILWAVLGCLPLVLYTEALEPNRQILAWPALCLLAGAGGKVVLEKAGFFKWRWSSGTLGLVFLCLAATSFLAYQQVMQAQDEKTYGFSRRAQAAAAWLNSQQAKVLTELGSQPQAAMRFFLKGGGQEPVYALVPWTYTPGGPDFSWGEWKEFRSSPQGTGLYLLKPSLAWLPRLEKINAFLTWLWPELPRDLRAQRAMLWQVLGETRDPWLRTICLERILDDSFYLHEFEPVFFEQLAKEKLQSSTALLKTATYLAAAKPKQALLFLDRARLLDPRRRMGWLFEVNLLKGLGQEQRARALEQEMQRRAGEITISEE